MAVLFKALYMLHHAENMNVIAVSNPGANACLTRNAPPLINCVQIPACNDYMFWFGAPHGVALPFRNCPSWAELATPGGSCFPDSANLWRIPTVMLVAISYQQIIRCQAVILIVVSCAADAYRG